MRDRGAPARLGVEGKHLVAIHIMRGDQAVPADRDRPERAAVRTLIPVGSRMAEGQVRAMSEISSVRVSSVR